MVFVKQDQCVYKLVESGVVIQDVLVQVSPLAVPSTRVAVSGVPPFNPNELMEKELWRFGKFAIGFKTVGLECKDPKLKHVMSLRRQVFMFLDSQCLDVSFRVKYGEGFYMVYASAGQMKCFECGDVSQKRVLCPHRQPEDNAAAQAAGSTRAGSADTPLAAVLASVSARGAGDGRPIAASDDGGPGSQLPAVGNQGWSAWAAEGAGSADRVHMAEPSTSEQGRKDTKEKAIFSSQSVVSEDEEEEEEDSDAGRLPGMDQGLSNDLYSLEEISGFLDETLGKSVKVKDYFQDTGKCVLSAIIKKKNGLL